MKEGGGDKLGRKIPHQTEVYEAGGRKGKTEPRERSELPSRRWK